MWLTHLKNKNRIVTITVFVLNFFTYLPESQI